MHDVIQIVQGVETSEARHAAHHTPDTRLLPRHVAFRSDVNAAVSGGGEERQLDDAPARRHGYLPRRTV